MKDKGLVSLGICDKKIISLKNLDRVSPKNKQLFTIERSSGRRQKETFTDGQFKKKKKKKILQSDQAVR